jgi:hypothetical protein
MLIILAWRDRFANDVQWPIGDLNTILFSLVVAMMSRFCYGR